MEGRKIQKIIYKNALTNQSEKEERKKGRKNEREKKRKEGSGWYKILHFLFVDYVNLIIIIRAETM